MRGSNLQTGLVMPGNTVIVANETDARFSRDFSVLLKHLRVEWVVLDSEIVPYSIRDKNVVLLGHPDALYSGEIIHGMLTVEEVEKLRAATDQPMILEKESPWMENRIVTICSGADPLLRRNAVEGAMGAIIASAPPASDWVQTTYDAELNENVQDTMDQLQFEWDDPELLLQDLRLEVGARPRRSITQQQAEEDVERLFYLFSHGYSGYAFFNRNGEFEGARERILQELSAQSTWTSDAFSSLLFEHLGFIVDCHMAIGDYRLAEHSDFWYDTQLELTLRDDGYQFITEDGNYTVVSINDADPVGFMLPSLNQEGEPIYRLGLLSPGKPLPLQMIATNEDGERLFEIPLQRSEFEYYSEEIFREDILGGIPVVRVRSFSDIYTDELNQFVETAREHRGDPAVVIDIRGNGGGNEHWSVLWIQGLTGQRAEAVFVFSELESKTSMIGRANANTYWYDRVPGTAIFGEDVERFTRIAEGFESGERQPGWRGPYYPQMPLIDNDTTVIVVTNAEVASAGEGLVMRISQAENVMVVGENTRGCLTFGNVSAHQLPHSKLMIWIPINFGLYLDQEFREEVGLAPDLWVPAAEAVNFAVAAIRRGTISTSQPLPPAILQQDYTREDPWARVRREEIRFWLVVSGFGAGGLVWAFFVRKRPRLVAAMGGVWIAFGSLWTVMEKQPVGYGLLLVGVVCLAWGGTNLLKARRVLSEVGLEWTMDDK